MDNHIGLRKEGQRLIIKYNTFGEKENYYSRNTSYYKKNFIYAASIEHNWILKKLYIDGTLNSGNHISKDKRILTKNRRKSTGKAIYVDFIIDLYL